jgi:[ribosomal protein S5]-alanine N-acetyltransferase
MLHTNRCELRVISENDYSHMMKLYTNEKVRAFLGGVISEEAFASRYKAMMESPNVHLHWSVYKKDSNEFIGLICFDTYHDGIQIEIGYQFLPEYWGQGYAKEVIEELLHYGIETLQYSKILAETQSANVASCKLLQSVGMTLVETLERFGAEQSVFEISSNVQK